jgi:hypothetical protein
MFLHKTKWSFGTAVWHKVTGDAGIVFGILLQENCAARYMVVFADNRKTDECLESELQDEPKSLETK